jgi:hypothetical protein
MKDIHRVSALPWTLADDDKLRKSAIAGTDPKVIAVQLKRTEDAIRARAARLKVIIRKSKFTRRRLQMG